MTEDSKSPAVSRGAPKGDKRARTRAKLLDAARALIKEKGYERMTMEDVAERAGMTSGAIYGNFKNRVELVMALGKTMWPPIKPKIRPDSTFAEKMRALAEATIEVIPERQAAVVSRLMGNAYALSHPELKPDILAATTASFDWGAAWLRSVADEGGLPMPAEALVCIIHAMTEGLLYQRYLTPELVPDEVFYAAFAALAGEPPGE